MSEKDSHPIRNGVVIAVVGSLITSILSFFSPPFLEFLKWLWSGVAKIWGLFVASYAVPGWLLLLLFLASGALIISFYIHIKEALAPRPANAEPWFRQYTSEMLYGALWRWKWSSDNRPIDLWCYCPRCDGTLVYSAPYHYSLEQVTRFFCEHCNHVEVASIQSEDVEGAKGVIYREIGRRLRIKERDLQAQDH